MSEEKKKVKIGWRMKNKIKSFYKVMKLLDNPLITNNLDEEKMKSYIKILNTEVESRHSVVSVFLETDRDYNWRYAKHSYVGILENNGMNTNINFCNYLVRTPTGKQTNYTKFEVKCKVGDLLQCRLSSDEMKAKTLYIVMKNGKPVEITNSEIIFTLLKLNNEERIKMIEEDEEIIKEINLLGMCPYCNATISTIAKICPECKSEIKQEIKINEAAREFSEILETNLIKNSKNTGSPNSKSYYNNYHRSKPFLDVDKLLDEK